MPSLIAEVRARPSNRLLSSIPPPEAEELLRGLEHVSLAPQDVLEETGRPVEFVHFPLTALCSVRSAGRNRIEIAMIGREGMTGISTLLGPETSTQCCLVLVGGSALRIPSHELRLILLQRPLVRRILLSHVASFIAQVGETALANARFTIEERLARRLLLCQDRLEGDIPLTHEAIASALGVHRPGVTIALQLLEGAQLIRNKRSRITIIDRAGLVRLAGEAYSGPASQEARPHERPGPSSADVPSLGAV